MVHTFRNPCPPTCRSLADGQPVFQIFMMVLLCHSSVDVFSPRLGRAFVGFLLHFLFGCKRGQPVGVLIVNTEGPLQMWTLSREMF